jgi:hypothetical protein
MMKFCLNLYPKELERNDFLFQLTNLIIKTYQSSFDLLISEVKTLISDEYELMVCNLLYSIELQDFSLKQVKILFDEGIIDYLLSLFKIESNELNSLILIILSKLISQLVHFRKFDLINLFLKEFMIFFRINYDSQEGSEDIYSIMHGLFELASEKLKLDSKKKLKIDFHLVNVEQLLEFILKYPNSSFHYVAFFLFIFQNNFESDILKRVIDKSIETINFYPEVNCISFVEKIVIFLKNKFRPWLHETIRVCAIHLGEETKLEQFFGLLRTLIEIFGEDCELYLSKYKVIGLLEKHMFSVRNLRNLF